MSILPVQDIQITSRNTEVPFFPNLSWNLTEASKGLLNLPTFNWIQAFFDAQSLTVPAQLVIWSGNSFSDGTPIVSKVRFAYSGERINFKGKVIYDSGADRFGNTINSSTIGDNETTDLLEVIAYGGMY